MRINASIPRNAQLLIALFMLSRFWAVLPQPPRTKFGVGDLLVTYSVPQHQRLFIEVSRLWRNGVRAHFIVDTHVDNDKYKQMGEHYNETYTALTHLPSHPPIVRQVLAPLFAYYAEASRGFKWLLLGDADTIFNINGVLDMLNGLELSADDPHILSDFLLLCKPCNGNPCPVCQAPVRTDPRCLPCPPGARVCPCRLPEPCTRVIGGDLASWHVEGSSARAGCPVGDSVTPYGGVGMIFSIGLLRALFRDPRFYMPTAFRFTQGERPYSDLVFAELVRRVGYGFTVLPPFSNTTIAAPPPSNAVVSPAPNATAVMHNSFFGTLTPYNDMRSLLDQVQTLQQQYREHPEVFKRSVSYHLRIRYEPQLVAKVLPSASQVSSLFMLQ